jgi:hypothetical protein
MRCLLFSAFSILTPQMSLEGRHRARFNRHPRVLLSFYSFSSLFDASFSCSALGLWIDLLYAVDEQGDTEVATIGGGISEYSTLGEEGLAV